MKQCKSPSTFSGLSRHLLASGQVSVYREEHERLNTIHLNSGRMKELSIPPEMKRDEFNRPGAWRTDGMWRLSGGGGPSIRLRIRCSHHPCDKSHGDHCFCSRWERGGGNSWRFSICSPPGQRDPPFARVPPSLCISSGKMLQTQLLYRSHWKNRFFFFNIYELAGCGRMNEMVKTLSFGGNICKSFM